MAPKCYCETWIWILPLLIAIAVPITFFGTYSIAVNKNHVHPMWPYISDTGTLPPESCIFGQMLNLGAFILLFIFYYKYRHVRAWADDKSTGISHCTNKFSLVLALISCLGLDIVANFQEGNILAVHLLGAITCFVSGTIYCIYQTAFTRKINKNAKKLLFFRALLSSTCVCATVGALAPVYSAVSVFDGENVLQWKPEHKGYQYHVLSTSMEWILVFSFCFFIGTFYWDFKNLVVSEPPVKVLNLRKNPQILRNATGV